MIPNDQELTRWMKKCNERYAGWFRIQFCKILVNPKAGKFPINQDVIDEECTPRYKVVIHYSVPEGFWNVYDVPYMGGELSKACLQEVFERYQRLYPHQVR